MKIPKQFNLLGQTITVEMVEDLIQEDDIQGEAHYRFNRIKLQKNVKGQKRQNTQVEASFCHELVHFILEAMREEKPNNDGKFVTVFARLLFQALDSFE